jgi:ComF family protein
MNAFISRLITSIRDLIYPPICLHCHATVYGEFQFLCSDCLSLLNLINPFERCPICFNSDYHIGHPCCTPCRTRAPLLKRRAAAFEYIGPVATLIRKLKYGNQPYLAKGLGAYMAAQFLELQWPLPDLIVPVPISRLHYYERGFNQSLLLAEMISSILQRPIADIIKRHSGDYSQAGLAQSDRLKLTESSFSLKNECVDDKIILLVDDVMTTGNTFRCCAEKLLSKGPLAIYGLACCTSE